MRFKIDENLPSEIAAELIAAGHQAETVEAEELIGAPDQQLLEAALRENRILFTLDKGIANVRMYPPDRTAGVVLFRPFVSRTC